jgi:hypothetical protein
MSNELALTRERNVTPAVWDFIGKMAPVIYESRIFGVSSAAAASAIMLKGYEIGLGFTASFELIQVVQGKPALSPRGALALLHNAPEIKEIKINRLTDANGKFTGYECYMKRSNGFEFTAAFTMENAKAANLIKGDSAWANYPENMCRARAIGFCADVVAPDICAGLTTIMKAPEQYGVALSDSGDIIDGTFAQNAPAATVESPVTRQGPTLDQLVDQFGAEAVMNANNGTIPMTNEEVAACAGKLGA